MSLQVRIFELRVGHAISERIQHFSLKVTVRPPFPDDIIVVDVRKLAVVFIPGHIQSPGRGILPEQGLRHRSPHILSARRAPQNCRNLFLRLCNCIRIIGKQHQHRLRVRRADCIQQCLLYRGQRNRLAVYLLLRVDHRIAAERKDDLLCRPRKLCRARKPIFHNFYGKGRLRKSLLHGGKGLILIQLHRIIEAPGQPRTAIPAFLHMENGQHKPVKRRVLVCCNFPGFRLRQTPACHPHIQILSGAHRAERKAAAAPVLAYKDIRLASVRAKAQTPVLPDYDRLPAAAKYHPVISIRTGNLLPQNLLYAILQRRPKRRLSAVPVLIPHIRHRSDQSKPFHRPALRFSCRLSLSLALNRPFRLPHILFRIQRQRACLIFQKDNRLTGYLPTDPAVFLRIQVRLRHTVIRVGRLCIINPEAQLCPVHIPKRLIDLLFRNQMQLIRLARRCLYRLRAIGHRVHACFQRSRNRLCVRSECVM